MVPDRFIAAIISCGSFQRVWQLVRATVPIDCVSVLTPAQNFERQDRVTKPPHLNMEKLQSNRGRSSSYTSSEVSDEDITHHQAGPRKKRKMEMPVATTSRIKAKTTGPFASSAIDTSSALQKEPNNDKNNFEMLGVAPWLVASLRSMEIKKPTNIQKSCIPEILKGRDCIGGSRTGTGKTVAFTVPILQRWGEDPCGIYALILT